GMLAGAHVTVAGNCLSIPLRVNALWYAALDSTAQALRDMPPSSAAGGPPVRDPSAEHFERLAGRFRRSFAKLYWCEDHGRICPPEARTHPNHVTLPDAEQ